MEVFFLVHKSTRNVFFFPLFLTLGIEPRDSLIPGTNPITNLCPQSSCVCMFICIHVHICMQVQVHVHVHVETGGQLWVPSEATYCRVFLSLGFI